MKNDEVLDMGEEQEVEKEDEDMQRGFTPNIQSLMIVQIWSQTLFKGVHNVSTYGRKMCC